MSLCFHAFLGKQTENLEARFIQAFLELGFEVQLHPELTLTENCPVGDLYVAILKTPPQMLRLAPDAHLLASFGYGVQKRPKKEPHWPPKGVGIFSYAVSTRTAAGRSNADATMQELSLAILAKETGGYFYVDDDEAAVTGALAFERAARQLERFERRHFDAYAYRFETWPPVDGVSKFGWPEEIVPPTPPPPPPQKRRFRFGYKFSWGHLPMILLLTYWVVASILYS